MMLRTLAGPLALLFFCGSAIADGPPFIRVSEPQGEAWVQVQSNDYSAVWMRRTGEESISFGVAVLAQTVDQAFESDGEFADWVRAQKANNPDPGRFETLRNDIAPAGADRPTCVRYETVVLDRSPGGGQPLRLEVGGLACLHPDAPGRYYDVQYSGRTPDTMRLDSTLLREGSSFVNSLEFTAPASRDDDHLPAEAPWPAQREAT